MKANGCKDGHMWGRERGWYSDYQVVLHLYSLSGCRDGCMWGRERWYYCEYQVVLLLYSLPRVEAVLLLTPTM